MSDEAQQDALRTCAKFLDELMRRGYEWPSAGDRVRVLAKLIKSALDKPIIAPDFYQRLVEIKARQGASSTSCGTKALLVQTMAHDLPWLIEQCDALSRNRQKLEEQMSEDDNCTICGERTSSVAANPNRWPVRLPYIKPTEEQRGHVTVYHVGCVMKLLREAAARPASVPAEGTWAWALQQMKEGKRVIHSEMTESIGVEENGEFIRAEFDIDDDSFAFDVRDFDRTDWQLAAPPKGSEE